jgi:hypothetical protein
MSRMTGTSRVTPGSWRPGSGISARSAIYALLNRELVFQLFNTTNDSIMMMTPTAHFLKEACPNTPITRKMGE